MAGVKPPRKGPRRMAREPARDKQVPVGHDLQHGPQSVALEEVLVNFQRSLARATRSSLETARADLQVGMGQRALYVIDGINVKLQAGVVMARDAAGGVQTVSVDLGAAPTGPGQATIEFRVASRPIEPIAAAQLVLADLDPLGLQRPSHRLRVTLIGHRLASEDAVRSSYTPPARRLERAPDDSAAAAKETKTEPERVLSPLPQRELHLYVVGTTTGRTELFILTTNAVGQADVEIDALTNRITSGVLGATFKDLDLTRKDSEFFVWAAADPDLTGDGLVERLISNVLQFTVKRQPAPESP